MQKEKDKRNMQIDRKYKIYVVGGRNKEQEKCNILVLALVMVLWIATFLLP